MSPPSTTPSGGADRYALPLEEQRAQHVYSTGSYIGKYVILDREDTDGRITLVLSVSRLGIESGRPSRGGTGRTPAISLLGCAGQPGPPLSPDLRRLSVRPCGSGVVAAAAVLPVLREEPEARRALGHKHLSRPLCIPRSLSFSKELSAPPLPVYHNKGEDEDEHTAASEHSDDRYPFGPGFIERIVIRRKTE